jgi:hypothetical protein
MVSRTPPVWVRALAASIPHLPIGRYWMVYQLRHFVAPPFMMRLPERLGGFLYECDQRDSVAREVSPEGTTLDAWPHVIAAAPAAPDPA